MSYETNPLLNGNVIDPVERKRHVMQPKVLTIDHPPYVGGHRAMHRPADHDSQRLREVSPHRPKHAQQTVVTTLQLPDDAYGRIMSGIDPRAIPPSMLPKRPARRIPPRWE